MVGMMVKHVVPPYPTSERGRLPKVMHRVMCAVIHEVARYESGKKWLPY